MGILPLPSPHPGAHDNCEASTMNGGIELKEAVANLCHYKKRCEKLSESLDIDLAIRAAACEWYEAWYADDLQRMRDANLSLRKAVKEWLEPNKEN